MSGEAGERPGRPFPLVGIGASAGGLEALGQLITRFTHDSMAFVVVQHLAPQHESMLTELLSRSTTMRVRTIENGMEVASNEIYVIPPNATLTVRGGKLWLESPGHERLGIDIFFRSLAEDWGDRAIGVVLSGTGTDGTLGLQAIKASGGLTFVQDPASARYDGMPRSALESGYADFCRTPHDIGDELMALSHHPYLAPKAPESRDSDIKKILGLLRKRFHHDLSEYKSSTIERRIERRMIVHRLSSAGEYARLLEQTPAELEALYRDLLIGVTSFFRDSGPFEALGAQAFPRIFEHKAAGEPTRLWVAGCSTGEEAYSLAICLLEFLGERASSESIQIFATDVSEAAIEHARRGVYPQNIALDVSAERLERFFTPWESGYQVSRHVRNLVVFAQQKLGQDAPFSRLDLVTCRNVFIYLQQSLQRKVLRVLHYGLNPGGFLLLGTSDTVGDSPDLFAVVDRRNKLYAKRNTMATLSTDILFGKAPDNPSRERAATVAVRKVASMQQLADREVVDRFGPPGVVIGEHLEILQFRGRTGPYLDPSPGTATLHILKLARPELHGHLGNAIHKASETGAPVRASGIRMSAHGAEAERTIDIEVIPLEQAEGGGHWMLVVFDDQIQKPLAPSPPPREGTPEEAGRARALERELGAIREHLQRTIDELETANEDLKASNEELQSSNEELQSTNEELETSKEELHSSNEELLTVNDELKSRMFELSSSRDDLQNLLSGVEQAVVMVDTDLRIRRYTRGAERLLRLAPEDLGRPLAHLKSWLPDLELDQIALQTLERGAASEREVLASNGRWYTMRAAPYQTAEHAARGVVLAFADVDTRRRGEDLSNDVSLYASAALSAISHPLLILDDRHRVVWANSGFYDIFRVSAASTLGNLLQNLGNSQWAHPALSARIDAVLGSGAGFRDFPISHDFEGLGPRSMRLSGNLITGVSGSRLVLLSIERQPLDLPPGGPA